MRAQDAIEEVSYGAVEVGDLLIEAMDDQLAHLICEAEAAQSPALARLLEVRAMIVRTLDELRKVYPPGY